MGRNNTHSGLRGTGAQTTVVSYDSGSRVDRQVLIHVLPQQNVSDPMVVPPLLLPPAVTLDAAIPSWMTTAATRTHGHTVPPPVAPVVPHGSSGYLRVTPFFFFCLETETEAQIGVPAVRRVPAPVRRTHVPAVAAPAATTEDS